MENIEAKDDRVERALIIEREATKIFSTVADAQLKTENDAL